MDMFEEQKLIQPLPEKKDRENNLAEKSPKRKVGRPRTRPIFTPEQKAQRRKEVLEKARKARIENAKKRKEEKAQKVANDKKILEMYNSGMLIPKEEHAKDQMNMKIKELQSIIGNLTGQFNQMLNGPKNEVGIRPTEVEVRGQTTQIPAPSTYKGTEKQAQQTLPQKPMELKQPDFSKPAPSVVNVENGGVSKEKVMPDGGNVAPVPLVALDTHSTGIGIAPVPMAIKTKRHKAPTFYF
jgi:hypothetical protein